MSIHRWSLAGLELDLSTVWEHSEGIRWTRTSATATEAAHRALKEKYQSRKIGFYDWPVTITEKEITEISELARRLQEQSDGALIFGIGGSHLGPAALVEAVVPPSAMDKFPVRWLSNVDAPAVRAALEFVEGRRIAGVVVSKSGNTIETLSGFIRLSHALNPNTLVAITDPETGELRKYAKQQKWSTLPVPANIGGRFSVMTAVGLLPLALVGLDPMELIDGAREMRNALEKSDSEENPAYRLAWALYLWDVEKHRSIQYLMPYRENLRRLADWYVQLWGESLGKRRLSSPSVAVGPTPAAALGTADQHSMLQLFREGPPDKVIGFLDAGSGEPKLEVGTARFPLPGFEYLKGRDFDEITRKASIATQTSLRNAGVPTYRISIPRVTLRSLGGFMFLYKAACAFAGELYGVDAFNQPGVEEAKRLLRETL